MAQEISLSSGGDISSSSGSVSYSIGQVSYSHLSNNDYQVIEGVQQPYEISVTSVSGPGDPDIEIIVYPNPTQGALMIKMEYLHAEEWTFRLNDMRGQTLRDGSIDQTQYLISIYDLPAASYLLELWTGNAIRKSFKIIKSDIK